MKKMTRIESARIVEENKGSCLKVKSCFGCFNEEWCENKDNFSYDKFCSDKLRLAEAYIKRHEQKCKKRLIPKYTADVQPDTTGSELKKVVMKPANTDPTPLEIAKAIRDNGYSCISVSIIDDNCSICPFDSLKDCGSGREINTESFKFRKQLIDSYIAQHENIIKAICAEGELPKVQPADYIPQPIRFDVPDTVYAVSEDYIRIVRTKNRKIEADSEGYMITATINGMARCYRTPEEALAVALKRWNNK